MAETSSLVGRRILLLSTEPSPSETRVRPDGAEVVSMRSLLVLSQSAEIKEALPRLATAKTLVLSSKHAVEALFAVLGEIGQDADALSNLFIAAVGRATSERLLEHGIRPHLVGQAGGAELAEALLAAGSGLQEPILHFRAAEGRSELADRLSGAGKNVEVISAYQTIPDTATLGRAVRRHRAELFHAIGFSSPKGAQSFIKALGGAEGLAGVLIGAIGATTAAALAELSLTAIIAPTPDLASLEERLATGLAETLRIG